MNHSISQGGGRGTPEARLKTDTGARVNYSTGKVADQSLGSYTSDNGDSGGSVYNSSVAKGIHSGSVTYSDGSRSAIFSPIENALHELDVSLNVP